MSLTVREKPVKSKDRSKEMVQHQPREEKLKKSNLASDQEQITAVVSLKSTSVTTILTAGLLLV